MTKATQKSIEWQKANHPMAIGGDAFADMVDSFNVNPAFVAGYKEAEKDLAPAFEFSFDVPDNDGHIVFTPMDNMTIRKELKLKKGERVIVSIRKEHEKE